MTTRSPSAPHPARPTLTERYVHAATRTLPEDQRADVADELRASIADRVEALEHSGQADESEDTGGRGAEYAALEELGDPDRLAAGYTGRRLQLIGPETYPAYVRVLKAITVTVVPIVAVVVAMIETLTGGSFGAIIGEAVWMALSVTVHIFFWVTLTFALAERSSAPEDLRSSMGATWTPEHLPELPRTDRGSISDLVASAVFLGFVGTAICWQQIAAPVDSHPALDPDLWSFWLPLILALLVAEMAFEVVKYRLGHWSVRLAIANVVLGAVFAVPLAFLAVGDRLLNPAAVTAIQDGWPGFDPDVAHTVVLVAAVVIWLWDSVDGWRKALTQ